MRYKVEYNFKYAGKFDRSAKIIVDTDSWEDLDYDIRKAVYMDCGFEASHFPRGAKLTIYNVKLMI
jgi:hypothetical protein